MAESEHLNPGWLLDSQICCLGWGGDRVVDQKGPLEDPGDGGCSGHTYLLPL